MSVQRLILLPGRDWLWRSGGTETYVLAHAQAASLAGYEPHVFVIADRSEVIEADAAVIHRIGAPIHPKMMTSVLFRRSLTGAIERFIHGAAGPHVLHAYGAWADAAVAASERLSRRGIQASALASMFTVVSNEARARLSGPAVRSSPVLCARYLLELAWAREVGERIEGRALRRCAAIVIHYESVRGLVRGAYGAQLPYRKLTYALPRPSSAAPKPAANLVPRIVSVSRHDARKGLDVLLVALARVRDAGVEFEAELVGAGKLLAEHRRLAGRLGLEALVRFPGRVADVAPYLAGADVFVLPSFEEGSGSLSVLEAMRAGTAIVSSGIDGLPEDLAHERTALLVAPGDPGALAHSIERLIGDPDLRATLAAAARAEYERRFTLEAMARELAELYGELGLTPLGLRLGSRQH